MITLKRDHYAKRQLEVEYIRPYSVTDAGAVNVTIRTTNSDEAPQAELSLSRTEALALYDYLRRALGE